MENKDDDGIEEFENEFFEGSDESCPIAEMAMSLSLLDKPFGLLWPVEKMEKFLIHKGYRIIERYSEGDESTYRVAVKPDDSCIPEDERSNIRDIFISEVQDTILNWLIKIDK